MIELVDQTVTIPSAHGYYGETVKHSTSAVVLSLFARVLVGTTNPIGKLLLRAEQSHNYPEDPVRSSEGITMNKYTTLDATNKN